MDKILTDALIGLELTFYDNDSKRYVTNNGFTAKDRVAAVQWWNRIKNDWQAKVEGTPLMTRGLAVQSTDGELNKDLGGGIGDQHTRRFSYTRNEEEVFWWDVSLDPGVVEVRTMPIAGREFMDADSLVNEILDLHVSGSAEELGFHQGGDDAGGGHINVDFATGFDSNHTLLVSVILQTDELARTLRDPQRFNVSSLELPDLGLTANHDVHALGAAFGELIDFAHDNADPFLHTPRLSLPLSRSGQWDRYSDKKLAEPGDLSAGAYKYLSGAKPKARTWEAFAKTHAEWLYAHPTRYQYDQAEQPGLTGGIPPVLNDENYNEMLHYQAVNISHVHTKDPTQSRVEFRFFKGQRDADDIRNGLRLAALIHRRAKNR